MSKQMHKIYEPELVNCVKPVEAASSIPPFYYTSDRAAADEVEMVFRRSWIGVGRTDIVRAPGDFITLDIAGQSIILLRDTLGQLRALANSCRHRGARLIDGSGNCRGLRCPFHSWFYGLDGKLAAAPHMERARDFDKADNGLISYRAEERLGFAFLCLSPNAPELDSYLGDFAELHAPWPLDQLLTARRREVDVDCNWKIFLEVFNEYYHLPFVHAESIDNVYDKPDSPDAVTGAYASQFGTTQGTGGLLEADQNKSLPEIPGLTGKALKGARYTWVFPNMTFAANRDALWCYEAYPLGASKCRVVQTSCFHPDTMALNDFSQKSAAYFNRMDAALEEDVQALTNQQKGLACPDSRAGRFQPDLEPNVAAFARWYSGVWN